MSELSVASAIALRLIQTRMDIDPLIDCDDEHWGVDWTQPEGTPSLISFFNSFIDMMHLLALSLRAIVSNPLDVRF